MTADEKLERIFVKTERAKKHLADLISLSKAFVASKPYTIDVKRDQSRRPIYYVASIKPLPVEFQTIAADVIHNLRVALDHLARQLWLMGPDARPNIEFNFPIRNNARQYEDCLRGLVGSLRQDAIEVLRKVAPYKGGKGHDLWVLNRLNNIDKHRLLITVGASYGGFDVGQHLYDMMAKEPQLAGMPIPKLDYFAEPADKLCPLKVGDELLADLPDADFQNQQFRFFVSFNEPGVAEAEPIDALQRFGHYVTTTIVAFRDCLA